MAVSFKTTDTLHIIHLEGDFDAAAAASAREAFAELAEKDTDEDVEDVRKKVAYDHA